MKFRTYASFDNDLRRLAPEHQRLFMTVLREHFLPAIAEGSFTGTPPWPAQLRIHQLTGTAICSLTWSFSGPDGGATFHVEADGAGEPLLVWRRIGTNGIYRRP